jgi:hypothetical protein
MTLTNRPALYLPHTATWLHLPPFAPFRAPARELHETDVREIPLGGVSLYSRLRGYEIELSGRYRSLTEAAGLLWQNTLRAALRDSANKSRSVDLQLWDDTEGLLGRVYRYCELVGAIEWDPLARIQNERAMGFSLVLTTSDPSVYQTARNIDNAPAGPYEDYLLNGGTATDDMNITYVTNAGTVTVHFPGQLDGPTSASNTWTQIALTPSADAIMVVTGARVVAAQPFGLSGTTSIVLSDAAYHAAGNTLTLSLGYAATTTALTAGELTIAAGQPLYLFIGGASTGGHANVQVQIHMEVAS